MRIFTFWEPAKFMPYYIRLCIETWKKFLPDAEIVVLDFGNLGNYASPEELGTELLSGKFSFMHISDAVRVLILEKYGGIWLDADTIILSSGAKNILFATKIIR